jgi:Rps23 Pro-64 3,4-dihydroxylase Tpa1-like proline 4-hydroxylase
MKYEVLDFGLVYYKEAIPEPQQIIDTINKVDKRFLSNEHGDSPTQVKPWEPWSYGDVVFNWQKYFPEVKDIRKDDYYYKETSAVSEVLYSSLEKAFDHYSNTLYPFAGKNIKGREYNIHLLKYQEGGYLPAHQDQGVSTRVLSTVMYLNDNYEGGEIEFINSKIKIRPEAGSIIFFPSNFLYVHEVHPITSGFRYSMPHWYHNTKERLDSTGNE